MEVKWIKIVTDIFDDEKILLIETMPDADSIIVIWFKLLCLAGKQNNSGVFLLNGRIAYTDEMFATIFRRPINTVRLALHTFESFGMIEIVNNCVTIPNWSKHQTLDKIEAKNAYMRDYMREYREKQKALTDGKDNCKANSKANVSALDKKENRLDKNRLDKSISAASRFTPPTVEDVKAYCEERNNGVDAQRFVDYYTANGWKVGRSAMKDWQAAVRNWKRRDSQPTQGKQKTVRAAQYEQRQYTEDELASIADDPILQALERAGA